MNNPVLIVMAAGMGSRYGGLKQMDPVGTNGELIIDFSIYDAIEAGFQKVIFVIKKELEKDFQELIDKRPGRDIEVEFAFQDIEDIPEGYQVPMERVKPWGTCQAVMSCRDLVQGPFAVINADDFYGAEAFKSMYNFLVDAKDEDKYRYCMIGYDLENTLTENGHVARGVCETTDDDFLKGIVERTKIMWRQGKIQYTEDEIIWETVDSGVSVSMNFWGFTKSFMDEMIEMFPGALDKILRENPLKGEFFLPLAVDKLIKEDKAKVKVLRSHDKWYGVTYHEDKQGVVEALKEMKENGIYPEKLWKKKEEKDDTNRF